MEFTKDELSTLLLCAKYMIHDLNMQIAHHDAYLAGLNPIDTMTDWANFDRCKTLQTIERLRKLVNKYEEEM